MRKAVAIFLIIFILIANFIVGYDMVPNFWFGLLWILIGVVLSGIGALMGMFIFDTFSKK